MGCFRSSLSCVAAEKTFCFGGHEGLQINFRYRGQEKVFLAQEIPRSISVAKDFLKFENKRRVIVMSIMQAPGKSQD